MRVVLDTNLLVSSALRPEGEAGRLVKRLRNREFTLLTSSAALEELIAVLNRPWLREKYNLTPHYIHLFLHIIRLFGELVEPNEPVHACRDPDDNKFLEIALAGKADCIVSRDSDLLDLSPFAGIQIVTPPIFAEMLSQ